jgi:hypothetical protein
LDRIDLFKRVKAALLGSLEEDLRRTIQEDEAVGEEKVKSVKVKGWGADCWVGGAERWKRRIRNNK